MLGLCGWKLVCLDFINGDISREAWNKRGDAIKGVQNLLGVAEQVGKKFLDLPDELANRLSAATKCSGILCILLRPQEGIEGLSITAVVDLAKQYEECFEIDDILNRELGDLPSEIL